MRKLLFTLLFCFVAVSGYATDYTQDANCEGAWLFSEGSGTSNEDLSSNGLDLTMHATYTPDWASGSPPDTYVTNYLDFERDNVDVTYCPTDESVHELTAPLTIVCWFKPESTFYSSSDSMRIIGKSKYQEGGWSLRFKKYDTNNDQHLEFVTYDGSSSESDSNNTALTLGQWYHIAVVWDGSNADFYLNGSADGTPAHTQSTSGNTEGLSIGANNAGTYPLDGMLCEVAIFSRTLSSTEINDIMDYGLTGIYTGALTDVYIDTDNGTDDVHHGNASGSSAYASLSYALQQQERDITSEDNVTFHCVGSSADTTAASVDGADWTTDSTYHITISCSSEYLLTQSSWNGTTLSITEPYTVVTGLHFGSTSGGSSSKGILIDADYVTVEKSTGSCNSGDAYYVGNYSHSVIRNCFVMGSGTDYWNAGFLMRGGEVDSSTAVNCNWGVVAYYANVTAQNVLATNNTTGDFGMGGSYTLTLNNCASEDSTADNFSGSNNLVGVAAGTSQYLDYNNDDFHLKSTSDVIDDGKDLSGSFTEDFDSDTRSGTWDIGADEYISAGGTTWTPKILMY